MAAIRLGDLSQAGLKQSLRRRVQGDHEALLRTRMGEPRAFDLPGGGAGKVWTSRAPAIASRGKEPERTFRRVLDGHDRRARARGQYGGGHRDFLSSATWPGRKNEKLVEIVRSLTLEGGDRGEDDLDQPGGDRHVLFWLPVIEAAVDPPCGAFATGEITRRGEER